MNTPFISNLNKFAIEPEDNDIQFWFEFLKIDTNNRIIHGLKKISVIKLIINITDPTSQFECFISSYWDGDHFDDRDKRVMVCKIYTQVKTDAAPVMTAPECIRRLAALFELLIYRLPWLSLKYITIYPMFSVETDAYERLLPYIKQRISCYPKGEGKTLAKLGISVSNDCDALVLLCQTFACAGMVKELKLRLEPDFSPSSTFYQSLFSSFNSVDFIRMELQTDCEHAMSCFVHGLQRSGLFVEGPKVVRAYNRHWINGVKLIEHLQSGLDNEDRIDSRDYSTVGNSNTNSDDSSNHGHHSTTSNNSNDSSNSLNTFATTDSTTIQLKSIKYLSFPLTLHESLHSFLDSVFPNLTHLELRGSFIKLSQCASPYNNYFESFVKWWNNRKTNCSLSLFLEHNMQSYFSKTNEHINAIRRDEDTELLIADGVFNAASIEHLKNRAGIFPDGNTSYVTQVTKILDCFGRNVSSLGLFLYEHPDGISADDLALVHLAYALLKRNSEVKVLEFFIDPWDYGHDYWVDPYECREDSEGSDANVAGNEDNEHEDDYDSEYSDDSDESEESEFHTIDEKLSAPLNEDNQQFMQQQRVVNIWEYKKEFLDHSSADIP